MEQGVGVSVGVTVMVGVVVNVGVAVALTKVIMAPLSGAPVNRTGSPKVPSVPVTSLFVAMLA